MATRYVIEGNLIQREDITVAQVGRLSDLLPSLTTYRPIEVGSLPRDCSYIKVDPTAQDTVHATVVVAQPPQVRRILFNESHGRSDRRRGYSLAMPYAIFWFRMHGTPQVGGHGARSMLWAPTTWGTAWSRQAPRNIETDLAVRAFMPNTWGDGRVCFGANPVDANQTLGEYINGLTNTYWTSTFNTDLGVLTPYGDAPRSSLRAWETATRNDRDAWRNWNIWSNERPLIEIINNVDSASWTQAMPDSVEPVVPQTPRAFTFYSVREWLLTQFTDEQRARVLWALTQADIEVEPEGPPDGDELDPEVDTPDSERLDDRTDHGEPVGSELGEDREPAMVGQTPDEPRPEGTATTTTHVLDGPTVHRVARRRVVILDTPDPDDEGLSDDDALHNADHDTYTFQPEPDHD